MPKKSREQKIKASQRLYATLRDQPALKETVLEKTVRTTPKTITPAAETAPSETERKLTMYFKADFKKSLLLISCVIALEIFFYFASMSSNFAWLFKF